MFGDFLLEMLFRVVIPTEHSQQPQLFINTNNKVNFEVIFQAQDEELQAEQPALPALQNPTLCSRNRLEFGQQGKDVTAGMSGACGVKSANLGKTWKALGTKSTIINPHWCFPTSKDFGIFNEFIGKLKRGFKVPYFDIYVF